ncbi:hypothetical protein WISP_125558 [Willisornis vidua]|uniref:Uncharacterized protein n=1 Tax=Willisornis vidua TaxID=1566151 RepID=A0ABQ9CU42_9PASS|nr:hypothetical protein WISP_125558 [Willisornis vidua]
MGENQRQTTKGTMWLVSTRIHLIKWSLLTAEASYSSYGGIKLISSHPTGGLKPSQHLLDQQPIKLLAAQETSETHGGELPKPGDRQPYQRGSVTWTYLIITNASELMGDVKIGGR